MSTFFGGLDNHLPALLVGVPLLFAFLMPLAERVHRRLTDILAVTGMGLTSLCGVLLAIRVFTTGAVGYAFGAASPDEMLPPDSGGVPVRILFTVDALGAFMVLIISVVGLATLVYSVTREDRHGEKATFYALFLLLTAGVSGMVATGDLFNLFVFLEISSLAGAALVAVRMDRGVAVEAALKYALLSATGGLLFLLGVALLYTQYGSLNIAFIARELRMTGLDTVAVALLAVPMAMKCGAVPMHFWMPDAYSRAPAGVTAFLVVSSQCAMYVLFRSLFTLFHRRLDLAMFGWFVIALGVLSMFIGVTMAIPQKDVKRLMAYHAISQSGYMLLGVGVGLAVLGKPELLDAYGRKAMAGGIFHIMNHALYKGLLFLTAGAVIYRTGQRDLNNLGGLGHQMGWTMLCFMAGALAIAGIPPFNGFASKFLLYESVFRFNPFLSIIAILVSVLTLASFMKVFHSMFMGPRLPRFAEVREAPLPMVVSMGVLAVLVILGGLFPTVVVEHIIEPAVVALLEQSEYIQTVMER